MNLFLKPLVCHATIPANSRRIPDKFPKCPRNPAKPSILDTSGFASGFIERKVQEPFSQTTCVPRNNSRHMHENSRRKFRHVQEIPPTKHLDTSGFIKETSNFNPKHTFWEKTSKNNVTHM